MFKIVAGAVIALLALCGTASAQCSSYPYNLTNGTTADATQVMANFNCAAKTQGATLASVVSLGVGTATPPKQLVVGNDTACSTTGACNPITIAGQGTGSTVGTKLELGFNYAKDVARENFATIGYVTTDAAGYTKGDLYFTTRSVTTNSAPSERARITSAGDLYVGISSIGTIGSASGFAAFASGAMGSASTADSVFSRRSSNGDLITFRRDTTNVGSISVTTTNTAFNTTSDERLKAWDIPQKSYEHAIRNIWVGDFRWKKSGAVDFGYRAQQAFALFPAAVDKPQQDGQWQMDYSKTAPLALWGVKDLYNRTDRQEQTIAVTRHDLNTLIHEVSALKEKSSQAMAQVVRLQSEIEKLRTTKGERWARN